MKITRKIQIYYPDGSVSYQKVTEHLASDARIKDLLHLIKNLKKEYIDVFIDNKEGSDDELVIVCKQIF